MSEAMKEQIQAVCDKIGKLDEGQQTAISLIAKGMALQKELSEETKDSEGSNE